MEQLDAAVMHPGDLPALLDRASSTDGTAADAARARQRIDVLFAAEQDRIYRVCLRFMGNPELARELAQDTFLTAYRRLAEFRGEGTFYSWLYGIARFKCLNARQRKHDLLCADGVIEISDPSRGVLGALRRRERDDLLAAASAAVLDAREQEAVYLRYTLNMGIDEITDILELTDKSGARGLLQRCKRKLGRELQRRLDEVGRGRSLLFESIPQ